MADLESARSKDNAWWEAQLAELSNSHEREKKETAKKDNAWWEEQLAELSYSHEREKEELATQYLKLLAEREADLQQQMANTEAGFLHVMTEVMEKQRSLQAALEALREREKPR